MKKDLLLFLLLITHLLGNNPRSLNDNFNIDGIIDEPIWQTAIRFDSFKTMQPDYGIEPSEKTVVYLTNDDSNLLIAFRCFDSDKNKIRATLTNRDNLSNDDWVSVELDLFNNGQPNIFLKANPVGVQEDGTINRLDREDLSYDLIWESSAQIDSLGYTVEIKIPFKHLKYPAKDEFTIGVSFRRSLMRYSEVASFPEFNPEKGSRLLQKQKFLVKGISYTMPVNIIPSIVMNQNKYKEEGETITEENWSDLGVNIKMGLSSELTIEGTYNPDFSQVEADEERIDVNLRNALYYSEKRPFFLEGMENFALAANWAGYLNIIESIANTRNIVDPIAGLKLNGAIGDKNNISAIVAIDEFRDDINKEVDKNSFYSIVRFKRNYRQNNYIGAFYTGREVTGYYNRVFGFDGNYNFSGQSRISFNSLLSFTDNDDEASNETSFGNSWSIEYQYKTETFEFWSAVRNISTNFRTDLGYVNRGGITLFPVMVYYRIFPETDFLKKIVFLFNSENGLDRESNKFDAWNYLGTEFYLPNNSWLWFGGALQREVFQGIPYNKNSFSGGAFIQLTNEIYFSATMGFGKKIKYDFDNPEQATGKNLSFSLTLTPLEGLSSDFAVHYADLFDMDGNKEFDYTILRNKTTYQFNRYLFIRSIVEYNDFRKTLNSDFLVSFTYIPGTVIQFGYGSTYEKRVWNNERYEYVDKLHESKSSLFFKASYNYYL